MYFSLFFPYFFTIFTSHLDELFYEQCILSLPHLYLMYFLMLSIQYKDIITVYILHIQVQYSSLFLQIQIKIITTILVTFYYLIFFPLSCILDSFYSIFSLFFIFSWCFLSFYIVFCLFFIVYITLFFVNHFDVVSLKNKLCITYYGFWIFPKI